MVIVGDKRVLATLTEILGCRVAELAIKYLGLPLKAKFEDTTI